METKIKRNEKEKEKKKTKTNRIDELLGVESKDVAEDFKVLVGLVGCDPGLAAQLLHLLGQFLFDCLID